MVFRRSPQMLARMRASPRLAVLMLLVFALQIAAAAACTTHDYVDLGFGVSDTLGTAVQAVDVDAGDLPKPSLAHAGSCNHCGCHHASALQTTTVLALASTPSEHGDCSRGGLPPNSYLRLELRPPIA